MPEEGVAQLKRNTSKQVVPRAHLSRYGRGTKGVTRGTKTGQQSRVRPNVPRSQSTTSLSQHGGLSSTPTVTDPAGPDNGREGSEHHPAASGAAPSPRHGGNRLPRGRSAASLHPAAGLGGTGGLGGHRYRGLSGLGNLTQTQRKPVIQLDREDDDAEDGYSSEGNDFEDIDGEDDEDEPAQYASQRPAMAPRSDSQLSIGIQPVEPTPPKLSDETVISVSSLADMASALKDARGKSGFVDDADLILTAVNRSKNLGDMGQIVYGWNTKRPRNHPHGTSTTSLHSQASAGDARGNLASGGSQQSPGVPGSEDPREFEKVFREYQNTRAISNPVLGSLHRISVNQEVSRSASSSMGSAVSGESAIHGHRTTYLPTAKKVNSLVATTANQMSDFTERNSTFPDGYSNSKSHGAIESVSTYLLNKIWQQGWQDPDLQLSKDVVARRSSSPYGIQNQAMQVQNQIQSRERSQRRNSAIKLT